MPTSISIGNISDTFKTAMREVIAPFFDGMTHKLSDVNMLFPLINNIQFYDPFQDVGKTPIHTIGFYQRAEVDGEKLKVKNDINPQMPAIEKRTNILVDAFVTGPREIGNPTTTPEFYHKVWSLLTAVLNTSTNSFAGRMIFNMEIEDIPEMIANPPVKNTVLLVGRMGCQFRYKYATYNLT